MSVFACVTVSQDADAADIAYFSGDFNEDQSVAKGVVAEINGNMNIKNGATFTVSAGATLTINSDVKVTVDGQNTPAGDDKAKNAKFVVEDGARVIVNGQLVIGQYGEAELASSFEGAMADSTTFYDGVFVYGSVTAQKGGQLAIVAEVMKGGSVTVSSNGKQVSAIGGALYLMNGATVDVKGDLMDVTDLIIPDNEDSKESEKFIGLTVMATGMDASKAAAKNTDCLDSAMELTAKTELAQDSATNVSQLSFAASTESKTVYKAGADGKMTKTAVLVSDLDVAGSVKNAALEILSSQTDKTSYKDKATEGKAVELSSANTVAGELVISKTASLTVSADLEVSGAVSVLEADDASKNLTFSSGKVTVSGTFDAVDTSIAKEDDAVLVIDGGCFTVTKKGTETVDSIYDIFDDFKGAFYNSETTLVNTLVACELAEALEAIDGIAVSEVTVAGLSVETGKDADLKKAGYSVAENFTLPENATLTVVNGLVVGKDFVVTLAVDSDLTISEKAKIFVDGKLIDQNGVDSRADSIVSDVIVKDRENGINTYTSLKIAIADQKDGTIEIQNDATVSEDMTIPKNVVVDLGTHTLTVSEEKTLTVDGVIDASEGSIVNTAQKAKVVVNNYVILGSNTDKLTVIGVYADGEIGDDSGSFVMSLDVYALNITDLENATVVGALEYTGDITLASTADYSGLTLAIAAGSSLKVTGTVTLSYFGIDATATGEDSAVAVLNATVKDSVGSVKLADVTGITVTDVVDDENVATLQISGTPAGSKASVSIVSGVLTAVDGFDATSLSSFAVAEGTELALSGNVTVKSLSVAGTMTVPKDAKLVATTALEIQGSVSVDEGGAIDADAVYLGTTAKKMKAITTTGAVATLTGEGAIDADLLYVAAGSAVDDAIVEDLKSAVFRVQGSDVMTVYGAVGQTVGVFTPSVTNAKFVSWYDSEDSKQTAVYTVTLGNEVQRLIALVNEEIYTVTVVGDNGIGTVAIDGNVLVKSSNTFQVSDLKAGQHTITVDLKYGFEGNPVIKVNGTAISGSTFTLSGVSADDTNVKIDISGTTPSSTDYVVPEKKDDGMKLTDYLLIVLVVLIVILAVIVAMRLMRS